MGNEKGEGSLSQEQVLKTLVGLGLTRLDSQVYIYLAKRGPQKGQDLSKGLKVQKQQLYRSLKNLQSKGIVNATLEHPARFSAVSFDNVVDIFVKAKMAEAQRIQENKNEILANWQAIAIGETPEATAKFNLIEGRGPIYAKILQMMRDAQNQLSTISTVTGLLRADQFGLFDAGITRQIQPSLKFRAITELSEKNLGIAKNFLKEISHSKINFEGRTPDLSVNLPQLVIRDEEEILFFITPKTSAQAAEQEDVCLWTNCKSLVQAFTPVFEDFWRNSTDIKAKLVEIETGLPMSKSLNFNTIESAHNKFEELMGVAKKEIVILTSAGRLSELSRNKCFITLARKGIPIKIMAPIIKQNFEKTDLFFRLCEVRHIAACCCETTIVDGKYLLQINSDGSRTSDNILIDSFADAFYSEDMEHVREMKAALNGIWKHAQPPSSDTLETTVLFGSPTLPFPENNLITKCNPGIFEVKPPGALSEKDVVNKIINAKKLVVQNPAKDASRMYASVAVALIHPPVSFELPDLVIQAFHVDKSSSFGAEDYLVVYQQLKPNGIYVPVSVAGENPNAREIQRKVFKGTPAGLNDILLKKDEIEIRVHGNNFFAAWAVPIPIYPISLTLPPACMQIEGYGNLKTVGYSMTGPSGFRHEIEQNYFDSFVTFFHPASKYSGPGTDAVFSRDYIITNYPPKQ